MLEVVQHRNAGYHSHIPAGGKHSSFGKTVQNGAPLSAKEIVEMYHKHGDKMQVLDMRKHMKTMVAETFFEDKYSAQHKCRGIWKDKPLTWDPEIPFCDPNNAEHPEKSLQKPSKKTLTMMMKYLVKQFEANQQSKNQAALCLELFSQTTDGGNPWMQSSDWKEQEEREAAQSKLPGFPVEVSYEGGVFNETPLGIPTMESEELPQLDGAVEEMNLGFDLVDFLSPQSEEIGTAVPEINYNIQTQQNDTATVARPVEAPVVYENAQAQILPPANNEVQGLMVSNAGVLGAAHTGGVFTGGEEDGEALIQNFSGQIFKELDPSQLNDLMADLKPIMMENNIQVQMENNIQIQMENSQPMMENSHPMVENSTDQIMMEYEPSQIVMEQRSDSMGSPVEPKIENEYYQASEEIGSGGTQMIIPTMVLDFTADDME